MTGPRLESLRQLLQRQEGAVFPAYQVYDLHIPWSENGEWVYLDPPIEVDGTDIIWSKFPDFFNVTWEFALNDADVSEDWIACGYDEPESRVVDLHDFPFYKLQIRHAEVARQDYPYWRLSLAIFNDPRVTWRLGRGK